MISRSRSIAMACLVGAFGLHAAGVMTADLDEPAMEEGGPGAVVAALGSSFADMTAGVASPETVDDTPDTPDPDLTPPPETEIEDTQQTIESAEIPDPDIADAPQPQPDTQIAQQPAEKVAPVDIAAAPTLALAATPAPRVMPLPAPEPQVAALPAPQPDVITAAPDEITDGAISKRPRLRSRDFEAKHAPKPAPKAKPRPPEPRREAAKPKPKPKPQKHGNNAERTANRGSTSGQQGAKATRQGGGNARSKKSGNAAVTNYPGKVRRCVSRGSRPRGAGRGTAVVAFRVASSGQLTNVGLARSSGNSRLDRIAVQAIKRVGRCPAPPPGARRSYSIKVIGQ